MLCYAQRQTLEASSCPYGPYDIPNRTTPRYISPQDLSKEEKENTPVYFLPHYQTGYLFYQDSRAVNFKWFLYGRKFSGAQ